MFHPLFMALLMVFSRVCGFEWRFLVFMALSWLIGRKNRPIMSFLNHLESLVNARCKVEKSLFFVFLIVFFTDALKFGCGRLVH